MWRGDAGVLEDRCRLGYRTIVADVLEYEPASGTSPFAKWFWGLEPRAAARVTVVVEKLGQGLRPDVKPVGGGVHEARIHYGPGYRVYFGLDGTTLIILLGGGDKKTQADDVREALRRWADYKARKQKGTGHGAHSPFP